jgi:hypothetical protein
MKRLVWSSLFALLVVLCLGNKAFATTATDLELISGGQTLFIGTTTSGTLLCDGTVAGCAAFGATGFVVTGGFSITASNFNGWSVTISDVGSNAPNCPPAGPGGPGCLNSTNITAITIGASTLGSFDFSSGFTATADFIVANTSALQTGLLESQQAYATTSGVDPLGVGTTTYAAAVAGQTACGAALTSVAPGVTATPTGCVNPGPPVSLELATIFTTNAGGGGFTVGGNISTVPEPGSIALVGTGLIGLAGLLRRKLLQA